MVSMQPLHMQWMRPDMSDSWSRRLGSERARGGSALKDLLRAGATMAFGSDWPIAHYDPRLGMAWARLRRSAGGTRHGAVHARPARERTGDATRATPPGPRRPWARKTSAGVIKPGFRADLTAFAQDPVECDADELPDLPVVLTVVDGRVVFWESRSLGDPSQAT